MKTIEERAREYAKSQGGVGDITDPIYKAYMQGCADNFRALTEWHDPKEELPEKDKNVIVKYVAKDDVSSEYYTIGRVYGDNKWDCESLLVAYNGFEIIGWRKIHE